MSNSQQELSILDALPPELRRDAAPRPCICSHCAPRLTAVQRAAHERVDRDWIATRIAWCDAHGYPVLDLIRADIAATTTGRSTPDSRSVLQSYSA